MSVCVLCEQSEPAGPSLLCESCEREHKRRIDRIVWFDGVREEMRKTLRTMNSFEKHFPDGAALFADAHRVLAETFPRIDSLHREMLRQTDEAEKRLRAAQEKGRAALTEESTFE
jgi:hypothetical protein